jgi:hypothetical protein
MNDLNPNNNFKGDEQPEFCKVAENLYRRHLLTFIMLCSKGVANSFVAH